MAPDEWQDAHLLNEQDDDEAVDSADDEEVDSDAAFDESDEDRFSGFFSSKKIQKNKKKKPSVRFADVDLNEDDDMVPAEGEEEEDEEEEDGDSDEFIDLLDVLDGKGEIDMGSDNDKPAKSLESEDEDEDRSEEESEEDDDEHEDDQDAFAPSEEEEPVGASDEFQKFISGLDTTAKKRKADDGEAIDEPLKDSRSRKRRLIAERTEAGAEDEFRARASGSKLQLDDLLAPLSTQSSNLLTLKKNTKVLSSASTKIKTLSAPLPHRAQERLDREAAYEQTKNEVDKWSATMKRIREAEHLSFPLQAQSSGRVSNLELAAKFKPSTKLESSVDALLKSAKLREEDLFQTEDNLLKSNNLSVEEVSQRRSELRHMRELMFRAELKAKRINKIKSKTYRKIKRKEKEKLKEKMLEAEGGESDVEGEFLKREVERARERATLKHKQTDKWAKRMKQQEHLDENGREQIEEMLQRGEQLRRKIHGLGNDESEEEESSSDEEEDDEVEIDTEQGILKIKKAAFDELKQLDDQTNETESSRKERGVFQMKFMKEAMARKQAATDRIVDDFVKELDGDVDNNSDDEHEPTDEVDPSSGVLANRTGGRMVYRPGAPEQHPLRRTMNSLASDTSSVTLKSNDLTSTPTSPQPPPTSFGLSHITAAPLRNPQTGGDESNPWLTENPWLTRDPETSTKIAKKKNEAFGKDSQKSEKLKNKLKKLARKRQEEREKAQEDARVEISVDRNLVLDNPSTSSRSLASSSSSKFMTGVNNTIVTSQNALDPGDSSDGNSEIGAQEAALLKTKQDANPKGLKAFQQRDLVALAFAGDNVVHEFEEAKKREMTADAPKDVDTTIPGWGAWCGSGLRKAPPKPERIKKIAGIDPKSRADYNKKNIIISEKRDKKASKYIVKDLPYPYTSRAQFERSMEQPLGKEWNTRVGFQRGTLPKVVKKPGIIIDPLEKMA